jgi:hypothetical protein
MNHGEKREGREEEGRGEGVGVEKLFSLIG